MGIEEYRGKSFEDLFGDVIDTVRDDMSAMSKKSQFGMCYLHPVLKVRDNQGQPYRVTDKAEYAKYGAQNRLMEIGIDVDIAEFSKMAAENAWTYSRKVATFGADWEKFKESFLTVVADVPEFKDKIAEMRKNVLPYLSYVHERYVEIDDVPQSNPSKDGKVYKTPVFVRMFDSREECLKAHNTKFKIENNIEVFNESQPASDSDIPDGWDEESWNDAVKEMKSMKTAGVSIADIAAGYGLKVPQVVKALKG